MQIHRVGTHSLSVGSGRGFDICMRPCPEAVFLLFRNELRFDSSVSSSGGHGVR